MISTPHDTQIFESVVKPIPINMMDDKPVGDWFVGAFPYSNVLELELAFGATACSAGDRPTEHPMSILFIPSRVIWAFSLIVGSTRL